VALIPVKKIVAPRGKPVVNDKIFDNIKAGQSLTIEDNVYFDQSSYILRSEAHNQLNRLATIMAKNPAIHIEIVGHTDNIGDPRLNQILSEQRSKVIANYLANQGVNEANITHRGEGQTKPIAPNDSEENRQRNRRVQFLVR
jgi:outer membrane protein OmpA-like peptidoglycan-associated protein